VAGVGNLIIARVCSGISGLDAVLQGGIPTNSTIALRAEPSNHTECFLQQFVVEGLKHGFPALYCCLSRPVASVINSMRHQGFDVLEQIANDQLIFIDCYSLHARTSGMGVDPQIRKKIVAITEVDDERMLQEGLAEAVGRIPNLKGLRAVCESVPGTLTAKQPVQVMRWGRRAFADLREFDTVSARQDFLDARRVLFKLMAHDFDGVMEIRSEHSPGRMKYLFGVPKMRMTDVPPKTYELEIEDNLLTLKTQFDKIA
jgi:KaiC/GvpD/RAD55 family RecA-like ATPase